MPEELTRPDGRLLRRHGRIAEDSVMHTPTFCSQHGEDIIASKAFAQSSGPRYFVEVGVIDGKRFSNTLALEQQGWRGVCVEAHPAYAPLVVRNRPGSHVFHAAAADVDGGTLPFYADPRGDLSTLVQKDEAEMKRRFGHWFRGYEVVDVPVRTLDAMLREAGAPREMEVVSIDIEGAELAALRGFDLAYWRPRLLILEADDAEARAEYDAYLRPQGYRLARMVGVNAMYARTLRDCWAIRLARVDCEVFHAAHPHERDRGDHMVIPSGYECRSQYARRVAKTFLKAA